MQKEKKKAERKKSGSEYKVTGSLISRFVCLVVRSFRASSRSLIASAAYVNCKKKKCPPLEQPLLMSQASCFTQPTENLNSLNLSRCVGQDLDTSCEAFRTVVAILLDYHVKSLEGEVQARPHCQN